MSAHSVPSTFLWHDYETWGADPRRDRPCQFAAIRTDLEFHEIGQPLVIYCRPAPDLLPNPEACLVTGITPQLAERRGLIEADFARTINQELGRPGTCGAGYNSMRFDDEVTRHLLYRNLLDPYAREWRNGNSRWDLIDTLRLAHALRPEGLEWPTHADGTASFRLEDLAAANGIDHGQAHEALADVRATIGLARRLRDAQPRLLDYALSLRDKRRVRELLDQGRPLLHVSARYPAALGCIAPILPLCPHPSNGNGVICVDLRASPDLWIELSPDELRARLFTPADELPAGVERLPLKTVHLNRAPILAPLTTLGPAAAERWAIDPATLDRHASQYRATPTKLLDKVRAIHQFHEGQAETDPDLMLYSGGFIGETDRRALDEINRLAPTELAAYLPRFEDPRLGQMLLRYRARNWPETLSAEEREDWDLFRFTRLTDPTAGGGIVIDQLEERLSELFERHAKDPGKLRVLQDIADWAERVMDAEL